MSEDNPHNDEIQNLVTSPEVPLPLNNKSAVSFRRSLVIQTNSMFVTKAFEVKLIQKMRGDLNQIVQNYLENLTEQPSLISSDRRSIFLERYNVTPYMEILPNHHNNTRILIAAKERHGREIGRWCRLHIQLGMDPTAKYIVESVDFTQGLYVSTMKLKNEDGSLHPGLGTSFSPEFKDKLLQRGNGVTVEGFPDVTENNIYVLWVLD